jgi:GntR family transcriptional regulator/MocR family aminotransferase
MRNAAPADLPLTLDRGRGPNEGLTRQLYAQLREAILDGRLRPGDRLPPTRALVVARLTVATAYEWLVAEGYAQGRVGAGTYVAADLADATNAGQPAALPAAPVGARANDWSTRRLSSWGASLPRLSEASAGQMQAPEFDMLPGSGAADAFPWARWRRVVGWLDAGGHSAQAAESSSGEASAAMRGESRWASLLGPQQARAAIAAWLRRSRGLRCVAEQVLIAPGVQQMVALLARLLVEPGHLVLLENPGYIGFHTAFLAEGARPVGVAVDSGGIRTEDLPAAQEGGPRLALVTPSHQYPTGAILPLARRLALLGWAQSKGATLIEDDYDGELRLEGQPLETLQGLDTRGHVIYLGTFAKALYPAVRLAFAVLPEWLVEPMVRARAASDRHPSWRDAVAVARFIEAGELERHLARVRRLYRARRDALVAALHTELDGLVTIGPAEAGIHLSLALPAGVDDVALARRALESGIGLGILSVHYLSDHRPGLLLGFGNLDERRLVEAVRRLAPLIREAADV